MVMDSMFWHNIDMGCFIFKHITNHKHFEKILNFLFLIKITHLVGHGLLRQCQIYPSYKSSPLKIPNKYNSIFESKGPCNPSIK